MSRYLLQQALRGRNRPSIGGEDDRLPSDQEAFYQHLGSEDVVRLEPDMDQDEIFDDQFERRAHELQRTPGQDKTVSTVPNKKGPWSGNNNLGIERPFAPDANNRQTIIKLPEWGFPETWTLCLGLTYNTALHAVAPSAGKFTVVAEIEFGTGGVIQTVEMDWKQGASIVLPMNALNVIASYSSLESEGGPIIPPLDLRLRANVVRGVLPQSSPTRSFFMFSPGPGTAQVSCPIPPFAKSVRLLQCMPFALGTAFAFYSAADGVFLAPYEASGLTVVDYARSQFVEYLDTTNQVCGRPVPVPIPDGARFFLADGVDGFGIIAEFEIGV
jgi:hypothetical protein